MIYKVKLSPRLILLFVCLFAVFIWLQYILWIKDEGPYHIFQLKQQIKDQQEENAQLQLRNQALHAQVMGLKSGTNEVSDQARSQLGMIQQGEIYYHIVPAQPEKNK